LLLAALIVALPALVPAGGPARGAPSMAFTLSSPAFVAGGEIPTRHTCEGEDLSPPLAWTAPPATAKSLALVVDDPDAPDPRAPKMTWVHWVLFNLPAGAGALAEAATVPAGARGGLNDWKRADYGGPCPPLGRHRYFFKLYALDIVLPAPAPLTKAQLEAAMAGHVLAQADLIGTYQKKK
jgi:Raf kinase inhibitor-like YbhB/YbcL family protein